MTAKLVIDRPIRLELISLNAIKGRHWSSWKRLKRNAAEALLEAGIRARRTPPTTRQQLIITRWVEPRQRPFDHENLAGGNAKALVDALTDLGYWRDDSDRYLKRHYLQRPATDRPYYPGTQAWALPTSITIYDLEVPT